MPQNHKAPKKFIHERHIWLVDLEPTKGIEMRKVRPCLVLRKFSQDHLVVLPLTTKNHAHDTVEITAHFLKEQSFVKISQIRVTDKSRFGAKALGKISPKQYIDIKKILAKVFQLSPRGPNGQKMKEPDGHNERQPNGASES